MPGHLDDRGLVGVDDPVGAARLGPPVAGAALDVLDLLGEAPEDQAEHEQATAQPRNAPRCSRHTSPAGLSRVAGGAGVPAPFGPQPPADVPAGGEQRRRRPPAAPKVATASSSGHQWLPPKGRICWPQPIGESQAGQALVTPQRRPVDGAEHVADAAEQRTRRRGPRPAMPVAPRVGRGELAGHRGDADEDQAHRGDRRRPPANEPGRGWPLTSDRESRAPRPATTFGGDGHDDGRGQAGVPPDDGRQPSISARPSSSFCRVCRTTANVLINAASTASVTYVAVQHVARRRWARR